MQRMTPTADTVSLILAEGLTSSGAAFASPIFWNMASLAAAGAVDMDSERLRRSDIVALGLGCRVFACAERCLEVPGGARRRERVASWGARPIGAVETHLMGTHFLGTFRN